MLPVNACGDAGHPCRNLRLQGGQVARVDDRWASVAEEAEDARIELQQMAWALAQRNVFHIRSLDAFAEVSGDFCECEDRMAPTVRRQPVDQVNDAVLEAPGGERVDDVNDELRRDACLETHRSPTPAVASMLSIDEPISVANRSRRSPALGSESVQSVYSTIAAEPSPAPVSLASASNPFAT